MGCLGGSLLLSLLVGVAVILVLNYWPSGGKDGKSYVEELVESKERGAAVACMGNLSAIYKSLKIYAIPENKYPPSLDDVDMPSKALRCPDTKGGKYIYIPGQNDRMPGSNVLVYEDKPVHDGKCNVLRLNGQIEALTPDQLEAALAATRQSIGG